MYAGSWTVRSTSSEATGGLSSSARPPSKSRNSRHRRAVRSRRTGPIGWPGPKSYAVDAASQTTRAGTTGAVSRAAASPRRSLGMPGTLPARYARRVWEAQMARNRLYDEDVVVVGLGRFGGAAALELQRLGHRVIAMERDSRTAEQYLGKLAKVIHADASHPATFAQG